MRIRKIYRAVCISVIIHGALFGVALHIAYREPTNMLGGGGMGETIAVSLISADGEVRAAPQTSHKERDAPMFVPSKSTSATTSSADRRSGTSAELPPNRRRAGGTGDPRLMRMWKKINRSKYYPLHARRNSWKGKPRVTFKTGKEGQIEYVRLAKSCGITLLDDAAIKTIRRAAPLPHYPKPITLTIRYSLRE